MGFLMGEVRKLAIELSAHAFAGQDEDAGASPKIKRRK